MFWLSLAHQTCIILWIYRNLTGARNERDMFHRPVLKWCVLFPNITISFPAKLEMILPVHRSGPPFLPWYRKQRIIAAGEYKKKKTVHWRRFRIKTEHRKKSNIAMNVAQKKVGRLSIIFCIIEYRQNGWYHRCVSKKKVLGLSAFLDRVGTI